jgi:hypothetical protein
VKDIEYRLAILSLVLATLLWYWVRSGGAP